MKLKIGTVEKKEKEVEKDYFSGISDEELEAIQDEVNESVNESVEDEVQKITQEITSEEEKELEEGVNGMYIFEEVGINTKYVNKFMELYPKKKIVYQNYITKQFLKWYIKKIKISLLKDLVVDSEFIKETQQEEIGQLANNRFLDISSNQPTAQTIAQNLQKEIEIEEPTGVELENEQEIQMYELLLSENWKNRTKGITELDGLILEQMRTKECDLQQALYNLINIFKLDKKLKNIGKTEEKLIEKIKPETPKTKAREIGKAIKYFHHIEFLYTLMGEKMEFNKSPTKNDKKQITRIKNLIESHLEDDEIPETVKIRKTLDIATKTIESFFEGD